MGAASGALADRLPFRATGMGRAAPVPLAARKCERELLRRVAAVGERLIDGLDLVVDLAQVGFAASSIHCRRDGLDCVGGDIAPLVANDEPLAGALVYGRALGFDL